MYVLFCFVFFLMIIISMECFFEIILKSISKNILKNQSVRINKDFIIYTLDISIIHINTYLYFCVYHILKNK